MSNHDELIERLRASAAAMPFDAAVACSMLRCVALLRGFESLRAGQPFPYDNDSKSSAPGKNRGKIHPVRHPTNSN